MANQVMRITLKAYDHKLVDQSAAKIVDTVKRVERGSLVSSTEDRNRLCAVQTPQAFPVKTIKKACEALGKNEVTDDCQAVELLGEPVKIVEILEPNFKITTPDDLRVATALLK